MSDRFEVILVDNVDSFSYNLVDEFAKRGATIEVFRNDVPAGRILDRAAGPGPRLLVISPGPGTPEGAGCSLAVAAGALGRVPLLGVCLGHQALVRSLGGTVGRAPAPVHGKATALEHDGSGPFSGLPSPMSVGRYHSLAATTVPDDLEVIARSEGVVMAVRHRRHPAIGVQFHPESVLTPGGGRLFDNLIEWAADASR